MPKRVVDGDALWVSEKLTCVPEKYRAEYAWILPLGQANGAFECSPMAVWRLCYSALRSDWTTSDVAAMLDAFEAAKMLIRWTDKSNKTFGFFIGIQKEGRLPKPSDRVKSAKQWQAGMVPAKELAKFLGVTVKEVEADYRDLLATTSRPARGKVATNSPTGNGVGVGSGIGLGAGSGNESGEGTGTGIANGIGMQDEGAALNTATPVGQHSSNTSSLNTQHNQHASLNTEEPSRSDLLNEPDPDEEFLGEDELEAPPVPSDRYELLFQNLTEKGFPGLFRLVLRDNEDAAEPPKGWKDAWEQDFKKMLRQVTPSELTNIIIVSQLQKNRKFYVRPAKLLENLTLLQTMVNERRKAIPALRAEFKKRVKELEKQHGKFL